MSKQLVEQKQVFSFLEKALEKSKQQDAAMEAVINHMKVLYVDVVGIKSDVEERFTEMNVMVQEVRDSVTLLNSECTQLHSAVASRSIKLTKDRFHEEDESFSKTVGKYRRLIWKKLKEKYDVHKYNCIRRIDFYEAVEFVKTFKPEDYI
ncbi:ORF6C domain-containing protein [Paenibacillus lutrae]|uniref:ABC transporter permease n=1 Tax=Paenibacillus lutrae TaxID=2078573 RepID=A0A7X3FIH2_9BACL|nr:ORF6C domain-containing protein [Paenibacillus lutrae]MVP00389.1 ABC transporter permease [Paenibacillus lutrae]